MPRFFPADSDAKLTRQGVVNCVAGGAGAFIFLDLEAKFAALR